MHDGNYLMNSFTLKICLEYYIRINERINAFLMLIINFVNEKWDIVVVLMTMLYKLYSVLLIDYVLK